MDKIATLVSHFLNFPKIVKNSSTKYRQSIQYSTYNEEEEKNKTCYFPDDYRNDDDDGGGGDDETK